MVQDITNQQSSASGSGYTQPSSTYTQPQPGSSGGGGGASGILLVVVGILALAAVFGVVWFLLMHPSLNLSSNAPALATVSQGSSANGTAILMSSSQASLVLGSSLDKYVTTDLFTNSFIINASIMESLVPQLRNNITSGWVTLSNSSNYDTDASLYYVAMTVDNNASRMSTLVGAATIAPWFMYAMDLQNTNSGSAYGLNYTYAEYTNSTAWAQAVYGWKDDHVVISLEYSNPGYLVNETQLVDATANATP